MIYLDYLETTPMNLESLDTYVKVSKEYIGGIASNNKLGKESLNLLEETTKEISNIFKIMPKEIVYTSGASEANNMALIGVALANHKRGKHIIVSKLEHQSIYEICNYLEGIGFEISYVNNDEHGLIDFKHLKSLIRKDTILVSINAVNSEVGVRQSLMMLRQIIKKENEHTYFHSDLSNAIGKTWINFRDIDLGSVSSHKLYGPKGIGFLYKNDSVIIDPILYGNKNNKYKPGMPALPLIVSMKVALKIALKDIEKHEKYITLLNERIIDKLNKINGIKINNTKYSIPHVISISFDNIIAENLVDTLSKNDIFVTSNNLGEISNSVFAIYNDLNRSKNVLRISLSHLTTVLEINRFLEIFEVEYNKLKI